MTHTKRTRGRHLSLSDLMADPHNANRGTDRGRDALARSLREYGAGRAVLIDRRGRVIAGNKTVEQARALNLPLRWRPPRPEGRRAPARRALRRCVAALGEPEATDSRRPRHER